MASIVASLALLLMIPASIVAFTHLTPTRAVLAILFGGLLFLPQMVAFDAPGLPGLDKTSLPMFCSLIGVAWVARGRVREAQLGTGTDFLVLALIIAEIGSILTNMDPLQYGRTVLGNQTLADIPKMFLNVALGPGGAYFLGRVLFRSSDELSDLLKAIALGGFVYMPLFLIEWRFSPQMHVWVYGFFQHGFEQTKRNDGWRPVVFMDNGLELALFTAATATAAWALTKAKVQILKRVSTRLIAVTQSVVLVMSNSLGALLFGIVTVPLIWFTKPKTQLTVVVVLAVLCGLYPYWRATGAFPTDALVDLAAEAGQDRAGSLWFRFYNEDQMLEKAQERFTFGWSGYQRSHVFDSSGNDLSVVDGAWIAYLGQRGITGLSVRFGMILLPLFVAWWALKRSTKADQIQLAGLSLIAIIYAIDLLPNGEFNNLPFLFGGAVMGLAQGLSKQKQKAKLGPEQVRQLLLALGQRAGGPIDPRVRALLKPAAGPDRTGAGQERSHRS